MAKGYNLEQTGPQVQEAINKSLNLTTATQGKDGLMSAQDKQKLDSLDSELAGKVDKVPGKGLSTNDYDNTEKGKVASAYQKPVGGIPASDLAEGVIPDTSQFITKTVNDLANYYLKTETYSRSETYTKAEVDALIVIIKQFTYQVVSELPEASESTMHKLYLVPSADPQTQNVKDEYITVRSGSEGAYTYAWEQIGSTAINLSGYVTTEALNAALANYTTTANLTTLLAAKQDVIADLSTIRTGAAAGATAYQKPSGGVPESDLASSVQTSLSKADTAIQPAEFNELEEEVGTIGNGAYEEAWDGSSAPVVADIPAGVSVTYNSTSYTGTLEASASTVDKIYLVSDGNGNYDRYVTVESSGTYSWKKVGTTAIPLSDYATKAEVSQLQQEIFVFNTGDLTSGGWRTTGYSVESGKTYTLTVTKGRIAAYRIATNAQVSGNVYEGQTIQFTADASGALSVYTVGVTSLQLYVGSPMELRINALEADMKPLKDNKAVEHIVYHGVNLLDPSKCITGFIETGGSVATDGAGPNYWTTDYIPVTALTTYYLTSKGQNAVFRAYQLFDSAKRATTYSNTEGTTFTPANGDCFVRLSIHKNYVLDAICFSESSTYVPSYLSIDTNGSLSEKSDDGIVQKRDLENYREKESGAITISRAETELTITSGKFEISARLDNYWNDPAYLYSGNHQFNFISYKNLVSGEIRQVRDDVAPSHVLGTTIGANHGQPCQIATITGHGFTNTAIGTYLTQGGVRFYIMRIVDADKIVILSENSGTEILPVFTKATTGTIMNGNTPLTISDLVNAQLYYSTQKISQKIMLNGTEEMVGNGSHVCEFVDIVEHYETADPLDVLAKTIARAGSTEDPDFTGEPLLTYDNIYRFMAGGNVIVMTTIHPNREMEMRDLMFAQSKLPTANEDEFQYYIPGSLPINDEDFRTPVLVDWTGGKEVAVRSANWADAQKPVNRIVTYGDDYGFALGFLPVGVGESLSQLARTTFEISNGGKIYAHGVDSLIGSTVNAGQAFIGVTYRAIIDNDTQDGGRKSLYSIELNGKTYIFVDYLANKFDKVVVDGVKNGARLSVIDSRNATLVTNVYNDGLYVDADYVANDTCFIVICAE